MIVKVPNLGKTISSPFSAFAPEGETQEQM
jgi:hypothetical protein